MWLATAITGEKFMRRRYSVPPRGLSIRGNLSFHFMPDKTKFMAADLSFPAGQITASRVPTRSRQSAHLSCSPQRHPWSCRKNTLVVVSFSGDRAPLAASDAGSSPARRYSVPIASLPPLRAVCGYRSG